MRYFQIKRKCLFCDKEFSIQNWRDKTAKFCSRSCKAKQQRKEGKLNFSWKGKKHLKKRRFFEETRKKLIESHKGLKLSINARKKLSELYKGQKCRFWKGGKTPENLKIRNSIEIHLWREAVFARDNWTCQKTGIRGGKLHPHHILNFAEFPELRFAIDNGITFSEKAHREFHKKYGFKNNTKEQIEEFINRPYYTAFKDNESNPLNLRVKEI